MLIMHIFLSYISILVSMLILDTLWIGVIARGFYAEKLGFLISKSFNIVPALFFYPIYALAVLALVVMPALNGGSWIDALWRGALLGLAAYAAYDLTNQATIAGWPTSVTLLDMSWGIAVTSLISLIAYFVATTLR
jgi:uncharacterized membrane protein